MTKKWIVFPEYGKAKTMYVVARTTWHEGIVEPKCECVSLQKANRIANALNKLERRYQ